MSNTASATGLSRTLIKRTIGKLLLLVIIPLVLGWLLAISIIPKPAVGIIDISGIIINDYSYPNTAFILLQIEEARQDPNIKAVVVRLHSPGGSCTDGQEIALQLTNLRQEKPVVGSVDLMAASAAYRIATATEPVYAKPGSQVGNIGIWARMPAERSIDDFILASGPFKLTADNNSEFVRRIEEGRQEFLITIASNRGQRLQISPTELSQGLLYTGLEGVNLGLVDHIGSQADAVEAAARQAGLAHYEVINLVPRSLERLSALYGAGGEREIEPNLAAVEPSTRDGVLPSKSNDHPLVQNTMMLFELWPGAVDPITGEITFPLGEHPLLNGWEGGAP